MLLRARLQQRRALQLMLRLGLLSAVGVGCRAHKKIEEKGVGLGNVVLVVEVGDERGCRLRVDVERPIGRVWVVPGASAGEGVERRLLLLLTDVEWRVVAG